MLPPNESAADELPADETAAEEMTADEATVPAYLARETKSDERVFRLIVAYDGTNYFGWQRQPTKPTVQRAIELALGKVLGRPRWPVRASSRTDAGVHAVGQVVVFKSNLWRAPADRLLPALNTWLPDDIVVRSCEDAEPNFHPLVHCIGKRYRYRIYASRIPDPLDGRFHWWIKTALDVEAMREAASLLVGKHDFAAYETSGSPRESTIRTVHAIDIESKNYLDGTHVNIEVAADGFLYNMVRNIVGTLVVVGRKRAAPVWVTEVLKSQDRREAGQTAPAKGLHLLAVQLATSIEPYQPSHSK